MLGKESCQVLLCKFIMLKINKSKINVCKCKNALAKYLTLLIIILHKSIAQVLQNTFEVETVFLSALSQLCLYTNINTFREVLLIY